MITNIMGLKRTDEKTMSELLREALRGAESLRAVSRAAGVQQASLSRFLSGETSIRLDMADRLAAHLGIECVQRRRKAR